MMQSSQPSTAAIRRAAAIVGVDYRTVQRVMRGERVRGLATMERAARALEIARSDSEPRRFVLFP
jgi:hypothetical protein